VYHRPLPIAARAGTEHVADADVENDFSAGARESTHPGVTAAGNCPAVLVRR
jgi:hypothetical protein